MATTSHSDRIIATPPQRWQNDARSHLDDSSKEPSPLIGDFFNSIGQSEKCRAVTYMSANRLKADVLGTKRFVAL